MKKIKLLIVTREKQHDMRYGISKSLTPVIRSLAEKNIESLYLSRENLTEKNERIIYYFHRILTKCLSILPKRWVRVNLSVLIQAVLERFNMGRVAAKVARERQFTHVHCHDPLIAAGFQFFNRKKNPFSQRSLVRIRHGITEHGFGCYSQALHDDGLVMGSCAMKILRNWETRIIARTDWVISPTRMGLQQLARDLSLYPLPNNWCVIPHPKLEVCSMSRQQARERLGWQDDCLQIISVGRHAVVKDFPRLIRACSQLTTSKNWHLTILGEGESDTLTLLGRENGISDRLTITAADDMAPWYSGADLYVSSSITESFGMANHEAICSGLPCILTAVGGVPEVAKNAATYIPSGEQEILTETIDRLLDNDIERSYLAHRAIQYAESLPDVEKVTDAYLACYQGEIVPHLEPKMKNKFPTDGFKFSQWDYQMNQLPLFLSPEPLAVEDAANILVFAPHPDDETLSMGGSLLSMQQKNCKITLVVIAHVQADENKKAEQRQREIEVQRVADLLKITKVYFLKQIDGHCRNNDQIQQEIRNIIADIKPDLIFSPPVLDLHRDHLLASLSIVEVWSQLHFPAELYFYEFWQPLAATHYVDISAYASRKEALISTYKVPLQHSPYQKCCKSLQEYRNSVMTDMNNNSTDVEAFLHVSPDRAVDLLEACLQMRCCLNK